MSFRVVDAPTPPLSDSEATRRRASTASIDHRKDATRTQSALELANPSDVSPSALDDSSVVSPSAFESHSGTGHAFESTAVSNVTDIPSATAFESVGTSSKSAIPPRGSAFESADTSSGARIPTVFNEPTPNTAAPSGVSNDDTPSAFESASADAAKERPSAFVDTAKSRPSAFESLPTDMTTAVPSSGQSTSSLSSNNIPSAFERPLNIPSYTDSASSESSANNPSAFEYADGIPTGDMRGAAPGAVESVTMDDIPSAFECSAQLDTKCESAVSSSDNSIPFDKVSVPKPQSSSDQTPAPTAQSSSAQTPVPPAQRSNSSAKCDSSSRGMSRTDRAKYRDRVALWGGNAFMFIDSDVDDPTWVLRSTFPIFLCCFDLFFRLIFVLFSLSNGSEQISNVSKKEGAHQARDRVALWGANASMFIDFDVDDPTWVLRSTLLIFLC